MRAATLPSLLLLLAALGTGSAARASTCYLDNPPAATLLLP